MDFSKNRSFNEGLVVVIREDSFDTFRKVVVNEFDFINKTIRKDVFPPVVMGAGDDCSLLNWTADKYLIQSTDCLVEDVHFRLNTFSFEEIAYKSLAVNISDISAMGGKALAVHLSLAVPSKISQDNLEKFFDSFYRFSDIYNIQLIGGDLSSSSEHFFINLAITGEVEKNKIKLRKGLAEPGVLAVTGNLGDSAAGLHCLENNIYDTHRPSLVKAHKCIPIEVEKAQWFAEKIEVQGMMDLSDGLHSDLKRVEQAEFSIHLEKLPMSQDLLKLAQVVRIDPLQWALCGGEDYRLLINCQESKWDQLQSQYAKKFGEELTQVGEAKPSKEFKIQYYQKGSVQKIPWQGYRHF